MNVLHVLRVPLDLPLDAPLAEEEARAERRSIAARELADEHGVPSWERSSAPLDCRDDRERAERRAPTWSCSVRAALAPPLAVLQPDRRPRAAARALRR